MNQRLPISDLLADEFTAHTIRLFRFDADLRRRIRRLLQQHVQRELLAELANTDPTGPTRKAFQNKRADQLDADAQKIVRAGYRKVATEHAQAMDGLATLEEEFARTTVNRVVGTKLLTITVPDHKLREIARTVLIGDADKGAVAADWWAGQAVDVQKRYIRTVRTGLRQGEGVGEIIARVRDTVMPVTFREAETLVRTSVLAVANEVRAETARRNADIVRGVQVLVTLDSRTSETCLALGSANAAWDLDGNPLPESGWQYPQPPGPPFHFNCRTILVPVLGKLEDIAGEVGDVKQARLDGLTTAQQESLDGQLAESAGMHDWLKSKDDAFVNDLLGKTRANLWRDGKLKLSQLVDQSARPLTIDQLKEKVRSVTDKAVDQARAA